MDSLDKTVRRTLLKLGSAAGLTDGELLARFVASQDQAAFEELLRRHGPMVLRVCRRVLQHAQDAEDAFQATFIVLARKAPSLARRELVANWLYGVAYRIARKARTSAGQRRARAALGSEVFLEDKRSAPPVDAPLRQDSQLVLDEEVQRLPQKYRSAIVLCYLQGNTNEQAAQLLGCQLGAVQMRLTRARDLLRTRLGRRGMALSVSAVATALAGEAASAAVPAALQRATVQTVVQTVAGTVVAAVGASTQATALADAALQSLSRAKVKLYGAAVLALTVLAALGAGVALHRSAVASPAWQLQATFRAERGITDVAYAPDGRSLALAVDNTIRLVDVSTGTERARMQQGGREALHRFVNRVVFSPDGKLLAAATLELPDADHDIVLWDTATGTERARLKGHEKWVQRVVFSPDGKRLASSGDDGVMRLWDVAAAREIRAWTAGPLPPPPYRPLTNLRTPVGFTADGKALISSDSANVVRSTDLATGRDVRAFSLGAPSLCMLALSPDGNSLASANTAIKLWDIERGQATTWTRPVAAGYHKVTFSPDGRTLASISLSSGAVEFWDARTGEHRGLLPSQGYRTSVSFSPDGTRLAVAGGDKDHSGLVELWKVAGAR